MKTLRKFVTLDEEYKNNKELKREDVLVLMEWAKKQQHLPEISELQMARFLHCCFFSSEQTKATIENYFTVRTHCPELFSNRRKETLKNHYKFLLMTWLPGFTPKGNKVLFAKLLDPNSEIWEYCPMNMLLNMVTTLGLAQHGCLEGVTLCVDAANHTFSHILKFNLPVLKKQMFYLQEAMPLRVLNIHVFNANIVIDKVLTILKPLLHGKLVENIFIHSKMDDLYKNVPQKMLPNDYGGFSGSIEELRAEMEENILSNMDFFIAEERQLVNEAKRLEKSKLVQEFGLGVEGTFKKLNID